MTVPPPDDDSNEDQPDQRDWARRMAPLLALSWVRNATRLALAEINHDTATRPIAELATCTHAVADVLDLYVDIDDNARAMVTRPTPEPPDWLVEVRHQLRTAEKVDLAFGTDR